MNFLEEYFNVKVYIDSQDPRMPKITSGDTAKELKQRITKCDKFILLATNDAIKSQWCNWELGFADAKKYNSQNMALLPMKPPGTSDSAYKGNEYLRIYPYILRFDNPQKRTPDDFYVVTLHGRKTSLNDWLHS